MQIVAKAPEGVRVGQEQGALARENEALARENETLAQSVALMRATLEATTDGILVTDSAGRVAEYNQRYVRMWQIPREVMEGRRHQDLLEVCSRQVADPGTFLAAIEAIEAASSPETFDRVELVDGRVFERSSTVQRIDAQHAGRVWSFRDVTERKLAEAALRDEAQFLELLNRTGSTIASQLDLRSLLQSITDATTEICGAEFGAFFYNTTDEKGDAYLLYVLSGAPWEAFAKLGHPRATPLFAPTFQGAGPIRCADVRADPRYGHWGPHHGMPPGHLPVRSYLAVSVVSRSGEVIGGLFFGHSQCGVFTERSERVLVGVAAQAAVAIDNARLYDSVKQAAEEREHLLDAERAARSEAERVSLLKDQFLATLSHELRTPLNAILGWSHILRARSREHEQFREGLTVIERNSKIQVQLIEDLLDMSRIISGKILLDVQRVEVEEVVRAAVASVSHSAEAKDIRLEMTLDAAAGAVRGDPNRLQQCFWNLLSNAIKFTPKGGHILVGLQRVNSHVEVCVVDSGQGIKPEFLPHMFERFRQADASTTRRHGGLGLGLSIVKHLVELHGGAIHAVSAGEGQGAAFTIELPIVAVHEAAPASRREHAEAYVEGSSPLEHPSLEGITVLAVDDEPDARTLLKRVLEECGARVFIAASASEGLELLRRERPDMIVSDIGMPVVDGYEFIRQVRLLKPEQGGRTPAAALTAFARPEDRTRALRAGYQSHVTKPVEPTELTAVVASLATRR
ncbi:Hypothetical protein CAP_3310 [Chondromyces apiculatus DSM 436]|uniref:histidine kinase n=1 Tax=Chondromyces apiculatus DSM 436 TaxID=1192034 RepID=A0A017T7Z6_9BACT|nr:Hypothetical protein CAP_3310 [Chondromyces apiculatus DSM 436]